MTQDKVKWNLDCDTIKLLEKKSTWILYHHFVGSVPAFPHFQALFVLYVKKWPLVPLQKQIELVKDLSECEVHGLVSERHVCSCQVDYAI